MIDQDVGIEVPGRNIRIAEADQDQRRVGGPGGAGVGDGIAHHDRAARLSAGPFDRRDQVARVGLGGGRGVGAHDGGETVGQTQGLQQGHRKIGALVGADREPRPRARQGVERRYDPRKGPALVGDMREIMRNETIEQAREPVVAKRRAGGGEASGDQGPGPGADHRPGLGQRQWRYAFLFKEDVERAHQIGRRIHQGAVEVEDDHGAVEVGEGTGQGRTPVDTLRLFR